MRIGLNARLLCSASLRGWNRYTVNLLAELPALGCELFLYTTAPLHESHLARLGNASYVVRVAPAMRYPFWEQVWLPRQCAVDRVDVLHSPFNFGLPWSSRCPRVLTVHDAIPYRQPDLCHRIREKTLRTELYHWIARTRAHQIITVSEHAKTDLIQYLSIPLQKITVTYEAADLRFHNVITGEERVRVRETYRLPQPYIFYVGGWEQRKNLQFLIQAFIEAGLEKVDLVLAGGDENQHANLENLAAGRVRFLGWVTDNDLPALYAEALCFVYPSKYEGFGLQICEAMAAGCPTLAARVSSLPEVLGNGGLTFTLTDTGELVNLLRRVAEDFEFRTDLARRAKKEAGRFSWKFTAEKTWAVYRSALGHPC